MLYYLYEKQPIEKKESVVFMKNSKDIHAIVQALKDLYPDGICSLQYQKDYELLFATRLSAQCTDERVNQVTPPLFAPFPPRAARAAAAPKSG